MRLRTCTLSALTLSAALFAGTAAMAADLPKEGTFKATYSSAGTAKATQVGKEITLGTFDENGLTVGDGILDHVTWHCFGLLDQVSGMEEWRGHCMMTDPAGDQIAANVASDGKYAADAKSFKGTGTMINGTGKYAGISGSWAFEGHSPEFRTAVEGTYAQYGSVQGSYKLQPLTQ